LTEADALSVEMKRRSRDERGPSQGLLAWRRFLVESLLCMVLIGVIVLASVRELGGILIGPFVVTVALAVIGIVRYER
jgi:ABC-type Co2+ transport system permease subunit